MCLEAARRRRRQRRQPRKERARRAAGTPTATPTIRPRLEGEGFWSWSASLSLADTVLAGVGGGVTVEIMTTVEMPPSMPVVTACDVMVEGGADEVDSGDDDVESDVVDDVDASSVSLLGDVVGVVDSAVDDEDVEGAELRLVLVGEAAEVAEGMLEM